MTVAEPIWSIDVMITRTARVSNEYGIHCRPSAVIAKELQGYTGNVTVTNEQGMAADPRSVLALVGLAICCGMQVTIRVSGPDEEAVCDRLVTLFQTNFDFPR